MKDAQITIFRKHLEKALNKFDSLLDIPDETYEKVDRLYNRLCKLDSFLSKTGDIEYKLGRAKILFGLIVDVFENPKVFVEFMDKLDKFHDYIKEEGG